VKFEQAWDEFCKVYAKECDSEILATGIHAALERSPSVVALRESERIAKARLTGISAVVNGRIYATKGRRV